jgi:hypothetical protein
MRVTSDDYSVNLENEDIGMKELFIVINMQIIYIMKLILGKLFCLL